MNYTVKKGERQLGPFTLAQLQQEFHNGNIASDDLAQSEGMTSWVFVSQIVGNVPVPTTAYGAAAAPALSTSEIVPLPYNLHWAILFLIDAITQGLFNFVWALVQANWARKLDPDSNALVLVAMYPAGFIAGVFAAMNHSMQAFSGFFIFAGLIAYVIGIFKIKAAMEVYYNSTENIRLELSGPMTFFFSTIYLQYHINQIAKWKKTGVLS
jgi:hypothetical protein